MMNGELVRGDQTRIMIPSVFRNEYLGGLRLLSNHNDPSAYIRVMGYAQSFVTRLSFDNLDGACETLRRCWAFQDPADHVKLRMPADDGSIDDLPAPKPGAGLMDILAGQAEPVPPRST